MGAQEMIVIVLFAAALFYVARMLYSSMKPKQGCGSNCKCGVDFSDIEKLHP